jgi:hypothetical protein
MYGSPEQVHLPTRGERTTLLQTPEAPRQVPMDGRGQAGPAGFETTQSPPVLTAPLPGEDLLLYIATITHVISSAIVVERSEEGHAFGVQRPVYFISEVLSESKDTTVRISKWAVELEALSIDFKPRTAIKSPAQFEMGRTIHRQADYKTGVLSTTIPRGPRRPKFLECTEPTKVLPIRRHAVIAVLRMPRRFPSDSIWRPCATESGM